MATLGEDNQQLNDFALGYLVMSRYYHHVRHEDLILAGRALIKSRREHGQSERGLAEVAAAVTALEADDFGRAVQHFHTIPFGGMGTFNDWVPAVVYNHEDVECVSVVSDALLERWVRLMRTAAGDARCDLNTWGGGPEPRRGYAARY